MQAAGTDLCRRKYNSTEVVYKTTSDRASCLYLGVTALVAAVTEDVMSTVIGLGRGELSGRKRQRN
jgi:hypothetical protein